MKADAIADRPENLRPLLHDHIDKLPDAELAVVHRVLLQLETERLADELAADLSKDPDFFDQIEQTVVEFRKQHPYRSGSASTRTHSFAFSRRPWSIRRSGGR